MVRAWPEWETMKCLKKYILSVGLIVSCTSLYNYGGKYATKLAWKGALSSLLLDLRTERTTNTQAIPYLVRSQSENTTCTLKVLRLSKHILVSWI